MQLITLSGEALVRKTAVQFLREKRGATPEDGESNHQFADLIGIEEKATKLVSFYEVKKILCIYIGIV